MTPYSQALQYAETNIDRFPMWFQSRWRKGYYHHPIYGEYRLRMDVRHGT